MKLLRTDRCYTIEELTDFVATCSNVYLYGAGKMASKLAELLKKIGVSWTAFVVTDSSETPRELMGHPIYGVDDIEFTESDGVILAVAEKSQGELLEKLIHVNCLAKIYEQRLYGRNLRLPDNYLGGAERDQGFFAKFQELDHWGEYFDTDKQHKGHDYLRKYELFLQYWKDKAFTLLELGVYHGGSLSTWGGRGADKGYFSKARIIGVDINPDCQQYVNNQEVLIKDLGNLEQLKGLCTLHPAIVVDDASHFCSHQIMALLTLWESLPSGGIYIMEDIDTSFPHIGYAGFDDAIISAYDVCQAIAESVTSGGKLRNEVPLRMDIERIAAQVDMISFIHGSCIMIKK